LVGGVPDRSASAATTTVSVVCSSQLYLSSPVSCSLVTVIPYVLIGLLPVPDTDLSPSSTLLQPNFVIICLMLPIRLAFPRTSSHSPTISCLPHRRYPTVELPPTPTVRAKVRHVSRRRQARYLPSLPGNTTSTRFARVRAVSLPHHTVSRRPSLFRPVFARVFCNLSLFIDTPTHTHKAHARSTHADYVPVVPLQSRPAPPPGLQSTLPPKGYDLHAT